MRSIRTYLSALAVIAMTVVAATSVRAGEEGEGGVWELVCCGPLCTIGGENKDYCVGDGPYTCCKGGEVE